MNVKRMTGSGGVVAAAVLTLAACSDTPTTPKLDDATLLNAAAVVADATVEDVALATSGIRFSHGKVSGERNVTFYDAAGVAQNAYDAQTTASAHFEIDVAADVARGPWAASVTRTRDLTVSGLAGDETTRTFDGSGSESISRSRTLDDASTATYDMSGVFTYAGVVVPVPGSEPRWPLSGTIHRTMDVVVVNGPKGDSSRTVDVTVTFDGDSTATAVINGETVEIDLSTRKGRFPIHVGRFGRGG